MKKKHKYLRESKEDKQLRQMLTSMVASIFLCIFCLVGSTWALFETSFTSVDNTLSIGEMKIQVTNIKGDTSTKSEIIPTEANTYLLTDVGTYTIVLTNTGTIPGYCRIGITDAKGDHYAFTSGTLHPIGYNSTDTATITIEITAEDNFNGILPITLYITSHWGNDPSSAVQNIDEDLFVPETEPPVTTEATEETMSETTENPVDPSDPTEPSEGDNSREDPTEPSTPQESTPATEPTQPPTPTEPDSSEPTVPEPTVPEPTVPESSEPTVPESSEPTVPETTEPNNTEPSVTGDDLSETSLEPSEGSEITE